MKETTDRVLLFKPLDVNIEFCNKPLKQHCCINRFNYLDLPDH